MAADVFQEVQGGTFDATASTSISATLTVAAGSILHVFVTYESDLGATLSCSDGRNGSYGSALDSAFNTGADQGLQQFRFVNAAAGSTTVTVSFGGVSTPFTFMWVEEIRGASISSQPDAHTHNTQTSLGTSADACTTGTVTPATQPALIVAIAYDDGGNPVNAGTGFTSIGTGTVSTRTEKLRITSTAAKAATFTLPSGGSALGGTLSMMAVYDEAVLGLSGQGLTIGRGALAGATSPPLAGQSIAIAGGTVSVAGGSSPALTGESLTTAGGAMAPAVSPPLAGLGVTMGQGTLGVTRSAQFVGQALGIIPGALVPSSSSPLTGLSLATQGGTVVAATSPALTGASLTLTEGQPVAAVSPPLAGASLTIGQGVVSPSIPGTAQLVGHAIAISQGAPVPNVSIPTGGQSLTIGAGIVTPTVSPATVGAALATAAGSVQPTASPALTGETLTTSTGIVVTVVSIPIAGAALAVLQGIVTAQSFGPSAALTGLSLAVLGGGPTIAGRSAGLTGLAMGVRGGAVRASARPWPSSPVGRPGTRRSGSRGRTRSGIK